MSFNLNQNKTTTFSATSFTFFFLLNMSFNLNQNKTTTKIKVMPIKFQKQILNPIKN